MTKPCTACFFNSVCRPFFRRMRRRRCGDSQGSLSRPLTYLDGMFLSIEFSKASLNDVQSSSSFLIHSLKAVFNQSFTEFLTAQPVLQLFLTKKEGLVEKVYFSELRNFKEILKKVLTLGRPSYLLKQINPRGGEGVIRTPIGFPNGCR